MDITIQFEGQDVLRALNGLAEAGRDLTPAMKSIAGILEAAAQETFREQEAPDGTPWADLSKHTKRRREKAGKWPGQILRVSGDLARSITSAHTATEAAAGTNLVYAPVHQFGAKKGAFGSSPSAGYRDRSTDTVVRYSLVTPRPLPWGDIPARPFLGVSGETGSDILDAINRHLSGALER